jgi:hypothetical protein
VRNNIYHVLHSLTCADYSWSPSYHPQHASSRPTSRRPTRSPHEVD